VKAVDTNVVVRFLTRDDPVQTDLAVAALREPVFVTAGVLMETEWVLRSYYRWSRPRINSALRELLALETLSVGDEAALLWCLDRHEASADLADMLHLIASRHLAAFRTFDRQLTVVAGADAPVSIELIA
jgi:predicted nucleic-acid-binding protein